MSPRSGDGSRRGGRTPPRSDHPSSTARLKQPRIFGIESSEPLCFDDSVRTTLTLDDDVAAQLQRLREERRVPFRRLVNEVLRRGLASLETPPARPRKRRTQPVSLGGALLADVDDVAGVLAIAEGDRRR